MPWLEKLASTDPGEEIVVGNLALSRMVEPTLVLMLGSRTQATYSSNIW